MHGYKYDLSVVCTSVLCADHDGRPPKVAALVLRADSTWIPLSVSVCIQNVVHLDWGWGEYFLICLVYVTGMWWYVHLYFYISLLVIEQNHVHFYLCNSILTDGESKECWSLWCCFLPLHYCCGYFWSITRFTVINTLIYYMRILYVLLTMSLSRVLVSLWKSIFVLIAFTMN